MRISLTRPQQLVLLSGAVLCASVVAQTPPVLPGNYPAKPVRLVIGNAPGAGQDTIGRLVAQKLGEHFKRPFIVENKAGASALSGMEAVARADPDGYIMFLTSGSAYVNAILISKVGYDVRKAFAPIAQLTSSPFVVTVNAALPVNSIKEFIAYARGRPQQLNYASAGVGSSAHIIGELLNYTGRIDLVHIPYKGTAPAMLDVISGRAHILFGSAASSLPQVRAGKLKALAVTTEKRSQLLPDMPTVAEGGLPGFNIASISGILVPAGTPAPVVTGLNREINNILNLREVNETLALDGTDPTPGPPEQLRAALDNALSTVTKLVAETGLKLE